MDGIGNRGVSRRLLGQLVAVLTAGAAAGAQPRFDSSALAVTDLEAAARVAGIDLGREQARSLLDEVKAQVALAQRQREQRVRTDIVDSPLETPLRPSGEPRESKRARRPRVEEPLPVSAEELAYLSIPRLRRLLRQKDLSALEVAEATLDRIVRLDQELKTSVTVVRERALSQAREVDERVDSGEEPSLLGIPWAAKDSIPVSGYRTTLGEEALRDQYIDRDAACVSNCDRAGAVLVAKSSMTASDGAETWFGGPTLNPWNGEPASGSAAAVASGMVAFALATEGGSSLLAEATACGGTGFKPTHGTIPRDGVISLATTLDTLGIVARSADDCGEVLMALGDQAVAGSAFQWPSATAWQDLRVGFEVGRGRSGSSQSDQALRALEILGRLGFTMREVSLPQQAQAIRSIVKEAEHAEAVAGLGSEGRGPVTLPWSRGQRWSAVDYLSAQRLRTAVRSELEAVLREVDAIVFSPKSPTDALPAVTGFPAVSVPVGDSDGRKRGLVVIGRPFEDAVVLTVARVFQDATAFHRSRPRLPLV